MSNTADDYGGETVTWQTQSTVWAAIKPMSGREIVSQEQNESKVTSKFIIRYQSALKDTALTASYRISYDGRIFPIKYIINYDENMKDEGKQYQLLLCEENAATEQ